MSEHDEMMSKYEALDDAEYWKNKYNRVCQWKWDEKEEHYVTECIPNPDI